MKEISALIRRDTREMIPLSITGGYSNVASIFKPVRGSSSGTELAGTFILAHPAAKTVRNKFLLFKPHSLRYFCFSSPNKTNVILVA